MGKPCYSAESLKSWCHNVYHEEKRQSSSNTAKQAFYGRYGLIFSTDETFIPFEVCVLFSEYFDFISKYGQESVSKVILIIQRNGRAVFAIKLFWNAGMQVAEWQQYSIFQQLGNGNSSNVQFKN